MKAIVVTPTYNERENISIFISRVLNAHPHIHIVVIDDSSVDGTADLVKKWGRETSRVHLIERRGPKGRGYADREGMKFAIKEGFDYIFQMDADLSHRPQYILRFLEAIQDHDVVIGSRLIKGGKIMERGFIRNVITQLANIYIRLVLGVAVRDCTTGFRCYRREVLVSLPLDKMISPGPSLLEEILLACVKRKYDIYEIPIVFVDRKRGKSKLDFPELLKILGLVLKIRRRNV